MNRSIALFLLITMMGVACNPVADQGKSEPVGMRLTGQAIGCFIGGKDCSTNQFEIVMDGYDRYYRKQWSGTQGEREPKHKGYWLIELVINDFCGSASDRWAGLDQGGDVWSSRRGGSGYSERGGKAVARVARRLWSGDRFVGVSNDNLRVEFDNVHVVEGFREAASLEHFPIPCVIVWTPKLEEPQRTSTYTIEKIEFTYKHDPQFFDAIKTKHFPETEADAKPKSDDLP